MDTVGRRLRHMRVQTRLALWIIAAVSVGAAASSTCAQELSSPTNETAAVEAVRPAEEKELHWHVELKQKITDRGTAEESTRTTLRLEATPDQVLSLIRVDIPFIEQKNGEPMSPHLGDVLLRFVS